MMESTYFLDANVPLYALGGESPLKLPCRQIMSAVSGSKLRIVTDVLVVQEVLHHCSRSRRHEQGIALARGLAEMAYQILAFRAEDIDGMLDFARRYPYVAAHDAVHATLMLRHGIDSIITADKHFQNVAGITALDPHTAAEMLGG